MDIFIDGPFFMKKIGIHFGFFLNTSFFHVLCENAIFRPPTPPGKKPISMKKFIAKNVRLLDDLIANHELLT